MLGLGTEGGTGSCGRAKTLARYGPGKRIPSVHRPQEVFNRLFKPYAGKGIEQVRADLKREASVLDLIMGDSQRHQGRLGKEDQQKMQAYLDSTRAPEKRCPLYTSYAADKYTHPHLPQNRGKDKSLRNPGKQKIYIFSE